jgi:CheY-like chemotaxis protein
VSIDPDVPRDLRGDPARLRQVLLNLLGNAIKFTSRGEVALTVNKLSDNGKEATLRFEVRDTGVGIPKNKLHLLFQPFSQVDASTTRLFGGTGLGLSIARQIVERMDGSISVSSTDGAGSTFWFTAKFRRSGVVVKPAAECFASLSGRRLLIVDDNLNSLQILESQALAWKMDVETAASADSALALMGAAARTRPFEVALVDVKMPEVDGIDLARIIKSDPKFTPTRILLISSVGPESEFHDRLQGLEIAGWLAKPISQSTLYNALVRTLAGGKSAESEAQAATADEPDSKDLPILKTGQGSSGKKLRVLLAEDNPINQKLAKFQLRKMGADVDCVANGREAVGAAMRLPYDAVLMDCQMPEMDGYEATREIRRLEGAGRHTPIIALTAHALSGDREACLAAGMDAYISKPVNVETLKNILGKVAQRVSLSPVAPAQPELKPSEADPSRPAEVIEKPKPPTPIAA